MSLQKIANELLRSSNENHKALLDQLGTVELAIKDLGSKMNAPVGGAMTSQASPPVSVAMHPQPEMPGFPPMPRQPEMSGVAMPRQPDVGGVAAAPMGLLEVPAQPRFDVPAAFHQRKAPVWKLFWIFPQGLQSCCSRCSWAVTSPSSFPEPDPGREPAAPGLG